MNVSAHRPTSSLSSLSKLTYAPTEEPPELRGVLFQQETDGTVTLLRSSGETRPDSPPDVGEEAAVDGEVFLSVDGIGQDWQDHRRQISEIFHGGLEVGAKLDRPIIGIHEGQGRNSVADGLRITRGTLILKSLQAHLLSTEKAKKLAYKNDPAVKTIYDQLRQSLKVGRKITLMAHSGGGAQAALAMSILAREDHPGLDEFFGEDVRVMGMAIAASRKDFELSGIPTDSILTTGSRQDPVHRIFHPHLDLKRPLSIVSSLAAGVAKGLRLVIKRGPEHSQSYMMEQNIVNDTHHLQEFLDGGPGGYRELA